MNLTEKPEIVTWPQTDYVYIEKVGPFHVTARQAWESFVKFLPSISAHNKITGHMALYKVGPKIYRAGVSLAAPPTELPEGLEYTNFQGGKYSRFVLTGPHSDLPQACGRVFEIASEMKIQMRDDFCIEHYTTDPSTTPAEGAITEILIPSA